MEGEYDVLLDGRRAGSVRVSRKGLYYRFQCRCVLPGDEICRLMVRNGNLQENLGIPVPEGNGFFLEKLVPIKRIGEGTPEFFLTGRKKEISGRFVPLSPEEPFRYIARLKDSYLAERDGKTGVIIPESIP